MIVLPDAIAATSEVGDHLLIVAVRVDYDTDEGRDFSEALCIGSDGKFRLFRLDDLTTGWRWDTELEVWTKTVSTLPELEEWEEQEAGDADDMP